MAVAAAGTTGRPIRPVHPEDTQELPVALVATLGAPVGHLAVLVVRLAARVDRPVVLGHLVAEMTRQPLLRGDRHHCPARG